MCLSAGDSMSIELEAQKEPEHKRWIPLARQVVHRTLGLRWKDVLEIYTYTPTIPLAEALALEARRQGSDTHVTLMTDDLWLTSMEELPVRWLRTPSDVEHAINRAITAYVYLGGPQDARRFRNIPPEKFEANAIGNIRQDEPMRRRKVRQVDLPIGRVSPERAEAYGLDYERWHKSYNAALAVDLRDIQKAGATWCRRLKGRKKVNVASDAGTNLKFETKGVPPMVDDGIISAFDVRRGFVETSLPAGKIVWAVLANSVHGEIYFTDPLLLMGKAVKGLHLRFKDGKLGEWGAEKNPELLKNLLRNRRGADNRMGWFSIGLNAAAEPCMLDNSIVQNDVGIGLGPHPQLKPTKAQLMPQFGATIGQVRIEVD